MKLNFRRRMAALLSLVLIISSVTLGAPAAAADAFDTGGRENTPAAATDPVTLVSKDEGTILELTDINPGEEALSQKSGYLALFTHGARVTNDVYDNDVFIREQNVALVVDAAGVVQKKHGPDGDPPNAWDPEEHVMIPEGGYIVLAGDGSWDDSGYRKPLFLHYEAGDRIKLKRGGVEVTAADFLTQAPEPEPNPEPEPVEKPELVLNTPPDTTVTIPLVEVSGYVKNYMEGKSMRVTVNDKEAPLTASGSFKLDVYLHPGPNTVTVRLWEGEAEQASVTLNAVYDTAGQTEDYIEVEAAPADITIGIKGPRKKLDFIDKDVTGIENIIALYTRDFGASLLVPKYNVAVLVDGNNRVVQVVNPSVGGKPPVWTGPTELAIPEDGYVLMAQDNSYTGNDIKRFLAEKFKAGDMIKLRKNGEVVAVMDLRSGNGFIARLKLENPPMYTVTDPQTEIKGVIENIDDPSAFELTVNDAKIPFAPDGSFSYSVPLQSGTNYVDVKVLKRGAQQDARSLAIFNRPGFSTQKDVILWVDQASNARRFQTTDQVREFLEQAKQAGVTSIVLDVKGVEGFVSYQKNDLTGRPYVSEIKAPQKAGSNPDLDLLQEFITHGHALGLKIHAAINDFAEGSIAYQEFAVLNDHLDWEERVHLAENNGEIKRLRESAKQGLVAFVNPSNEEVRQYQLKTFEEIIKNYQVDGVVHDRGRYDNEGADFSVETRAQFEQFLQARGKQLVNWPNDIFYYDQSVRVYGPLIQDWWEFRSATIQSFFGEVKSLVDSYEASTGRNIQVSSYVGSWYETYYLNGVNWGSKNFRFDPRLGMPDESVYTPAYYDTGYIESLDYLMIGAYQTTSSEVKKYITLGNIVTNGEIPLYAGIALNNVQEPAVQREVFQAGLGSTNGLMLFDASMVNWPVITASLQDKDWVKDYQLGMSLPGNPDGFLEGDFYNVNRVEGNINVMTDTFGYSTGTNHFGVEVVVNASGEVTHVANREQAIQWNWGSPEENNSVIPLGGFVISSIDPSGVRTKRQLVANAYNKGDQVRSAVLSGLLDDEGKQIADNRVKVEGRAEVLGPGKVEVRFNGQKADVKTNGEFSAVIPLSPGANAVTFEVYVDGLKTNSKTIEMTRTTGGDNGGGPSNPGNSGNSGNPGKPSAPERIKMTKETGTDGRIVVRADVQLEPMLQELERLVKESAKKPELIYGVKEAGDTVELSLPVSGLHTALQKISSGTLVLETQSGRLELPLASLKAELSAKPEAELLTVTIGRLAEAEASALKARLSKEDGAKLLSSVKVNFALRKGQKSEELSRFKQGYAVLTLPVNGTDGPGHTGAFRYTQDQLAFIPAVLSGSKEGGPAKLRLQAGGILAVVQKEKRFQDLKGHWAAWEIEELASKGLVQGESGEAFAPNRPVTRAEFTSLLVRALGLDDTASKESGFSDVSGDDWFAGAVTAAAASGLIDGYRNGEFRPDESITREQMSLLLARAVELTGGRLETGGELPAILERFQDAEAIASWSGPAVAAAVHSGLMQGRSSGHFAPDAPSTRAESAVVLKRLLQLVGYINGRE
ncbi:S-layer protein [Paenibacillus selenitireducens]|uniref:S-layer protein n=1 Tax=Paenibacillus selenitireducens TaxID=1324314 RepID=A0A1T2X038_9BACL|nr:S-layer homology domain-containing protein [Paenibacillus selenitireducens]OPA72963.1 S-layer protein [Paenibacillus selenitireducens]